MRSTGFDTNLSRVQELLNKIAEDAAARLTLAPGRAADQDRSRLRTFLKVETHRLKLAHRNGASGVVICQARAAILDHVIRHLWEAVLAGLSAQAREEFPPIAVVALGGYGRGELNPHSDIDLMFLHEGQVVAHRTKPLPPLERIMDGVWLPLFDLGLKPGHSVRTVAECVAAANDKSDPRSVETKTSLIEARLIVGDAKLFSRFEKGVLDRCVRGYEEKYIRARIEDQAARRAKFGNSACMQEPNIKNGCGGLRDFQNLLWMSFFKYQTRSLQDLRQHELASEKERQELEAAYDFLLRVRTELHYHTNRQVDALTKNLQPAIAHNLGYTERSPSRRIEKFMRDVYVHSRNIYLITRTLEQRLALLPQRHKRLSLRSFLPKSREPVAEPLDGFKFLNGEIHAASKHVFRDQPRRLMRVFLHAQQRGLRLHPDLAQLLRNQLTLVDREFLADAHLRETFLTILNQRGNVAPILRAMHEVDFLGKYLPEFGKLTCLVQHEFYHQYAADEHTLMCVEQLDRIWEAKAPPYQAYAPLFQSLDRPFLLYLALLLHDTGKANGRGDHSEIGARKARQAARRLGLDSPATKLLCLLIKHHLLMANVSQRRDLDDPAVIRQFAGQVETPETLTLLTLHTFVDAQATSDQLWNGFKDALLWELHLRTRPLLTGGTEFVRAEEKQRESLMAEVRALLPPDFDAEELAAHAATLPPRYFQIQNARGIHDDLILAHQFMWRQILGEQNALAPVVNVQHEPDRGCSIVHVCTWDRTGLFGKIAGALSAAGLNILSAQIFSRTDGIVLDTFYVTDAVTGNPASLTQRDTFEQLLGRVLTGEEVDLPVLIARQQISRPLYQAYTGDRIPTQIVFDNDASETRTFLEIETEDRIGLLYTMAQTLAELQLDITAARICTEKGAAIDSLYVQEIGGGKVLSLERQKTITRRLQHAIHELDAVRR